MRFLLLFILLLNFDSLIAEEKVTFQANAKIISEDFEIDGNINKPIWKDQEWNYLKYSDTRIAGMAKTNSKGFKILISNEYLYILFRGKNFSVSNQEKIDQAGFEEIPQFGFWIKNDQKPSEVYLVALSTSGQGTHAIVNGDVLDFTWNPEIQFVKKSESNELLFEIKIKLDKLNFLKTANEFSFNFYAKENEGKFKKSRDNYLSHFIWSPSFEFSTFAVSTLAFGRIKKVAAPTKSEYPNVGLNQVANKKLAIDFDKIQNGLKRKDIIFVPKATEKIIIDGKLEEGSWQEFDKHNHMAPLNFFDSLFAYPPEINRTHFKLLTDKEHLYVGFVCDENNMGGLVTNSEALWSDDIVDFIFDLKFGQSVFSDAYFIIESNPVGKSNTALGSQRQWKPASYDIKYTHDKSKWIIEYKIAWKDLGMSPNEIPLISGANFYRFRANERGGYKDIAIANTEFSWVRNNIGDPHIPAKFGLLYFEQGNIIFSNIANALGLKKDLNSNIKVQPLLVPEPKIELIPNVKRTSKLIDPKVLREKSDKIKIEFSVTNEIDVTVNILDKSGQIVCHLGSGLVGENSPLPFQKGLKQMLTWEFTNDFGKKVSKSENYFIDIKIGLDLEFDKVLVGDPHKLSVVLGMCLDKAGNLIVLNETKGHGHYRSYHILSYDKNGKFKNEILPPPSTLEYESVKGISPIRLSDKKWMPVMYKPMLHAYIPQLPALKRQMPVVSKTGEIYIANSITEVLLEFPHRIIKVGLDGSVKNDYLGPILSEEFLGGTPALALSKDEKFIYATGFTGNSRWGGEPHHVVYKISLTQDEYDWKSEFRKPFIGELFEKGGMEKLDTPRDIAISNLEDIIIADKNNNRIVIFDKTGAFKSEFNCKQPIGVEYSDKFRCYYVLREEVESRQIVKYDFNGKKVSAFNLPEMYKKIDSFFCIDDSDDKVIIHYLYNMNQIKQLLDTGYSLVDKGEFISSHIGPNESFDRSNNFDSFEISHDGKKIFLTEISAYGYGKNYSVYDSQSGAPLPYDKIYQWGADGKLYSKDHGRTEEIARFSDTFEPIPFKTSKTIESKRGLPFAVDKEGFVFVPFTQGVKKFSPEGELLTSSFIKVSLPSKTGASVSSFAQDKEGQFYIMSPIKPKEEQIPAFFNNKLPLDKEVYPGPDMEYTFYYSSIIKFKAEGGFSCDDEGGAFVEGRGYDGLHPVKLSGMVWTHFGVSPYNYRTTNHARCACEHGKFHKDNNDLFYYTDAMRYSIVIIDKNQNVIKRIGEYGNKNSFVKDSNETKMGFAWPTCIKTNDEACFVSDKVNRKIIRLNYIYQDKTRIVLDAK